MNLFGAAVGEATSRKRQAPSSDRTHAFGAPGSRAVATSGAGSNGLRIGSRPTWVISGRVHAARRSNASLTTSPLRQETREELVDCDLGLPLRGRGVVGARNHQRELVDRR